MPATGQLRTANYDEAARRRFGDAVTAARTADGHKNRPSFAAKHSINLRSLELIEAGKPGVGQAVLFQVGQAISNWTIETPRIILEGGPIPELPDQATDPLDVPGVPVHEFKPDERAKIEAMSIDEISAMAFDLAKKSELAARIWLREATRVKMEAAARDARVEQGAAVEATRDDTPKRGKITSP